MRESGYGTITQSNTTDDDNGLVSSHSDKTVEDEVFITRVSPDSSSSSERTTSADLQCTTESSTSLDSTSIIKSSTPILISPPVEYTNDSCSRSTTNFVTLTKPVTNTLTPMGFTTSYVGIKKKFAKQIHLDSEILQEIDRQNSISSPLDSIPNEITVDNDAPYISMNPAVTPATDTCSSALLQSGSSLGSPNPQTPSRSYSFSPRPSSHYQTPPLSASLQTQAHSRLNVPKRTGSYHHYKNVPISYIRVHNDIPVNQSFNYRVVPTSQTGFVKRVLLRSTKFQPANVHMVVISNQEENEEEGRVMVKSGERVLGLFALQDDVVVESPRGVIGRVPYSSCRISKAIYGSTSKIIKYASLRLYNISTLCIESSSNEDPTLLPLAINMICIKPFSAERKDELTVEVGDHLRTLFSDDMWVFGRLQNGKSGFVPRDCCRPSRRSIQALSFSRWLIPSLLFQSDFVFNLQEPPPTYLLMHPLFPNKEVGNIVMVTQNYTPPGTQVLIRRGVCVKAIFCEEHFNYVATISGSSFWIPAPFTVPAPKIPHMPMMPIRTQSFNQGTQTTKNTNTGPVYATPKPRNRSNTVDICESEKNLPKKKVSFATGNPMVFRQSMGSNPELAASLSSIRVSPRRRGSNENIPVFMLFNDSPVPSSFCGCFKF